MTVAALAALLALLLRFGTGTWAHPSTLFAGAWAIFLAVPALLIPGVRPYEGAAVLILGAIIAVSLSAPLAISVSDALPRHIRATSAVRWLTVVGAVAAVASAIITQAANGISVVSYLSLDAISVAARQLTVLRYDGTMDAPPIAIALLGLTYAAAYTAPFAAAERTGIQRLTYLVSPAIGSAIYASFTTARAPLLITVAITASAWLVTRAVTLGGRPKLPPRAILGLLIGAVTMIAMFVVVAASRAGGFSATSTESLRRTAALYAGGSVPALDAWLPSAGGAYFGAQTFAGAGRYILGDPSIGAAYSRFIDIGDGLNTNVFTAFRLLIEDFTPTGMLLVLLLTGLAVSLAYRRAILHGSMSAAMVVAAWGGYVLFSQTTSILSFTNVMFGTIVAWVVIAHGVRAVPSPFHVRGQPPGRATLIASAV